MSVELVEVDASENEELSQDEEYYNKYLLARPLNINRTGSSDAVKAITNFLLEEIGYTQSKDNKGFLNMRTLICDLYQNYVGYFDRYLRVGMSKLRGRYIVPKQYNLHKISYDPLRRCVLGLARKRYIEWKRGYFNPSFKDGYQTRIKAKPKLIEAMSKFGVSMDMIFLNPDREIILFRSEPKDRDVTYKGRDSKVRKYTVKVKKLQEFTKYEERRKVWRNTLRNYISLLDGTYIDVDTRRYVPEKKIVIDLSDKDIRRIFSHGSIEKGGRFYGGFWQSLPEELRERIILNCEHVIEIDFSGMMVHILYAIEGIRIKDLELLPYVIEKTEETKKERNLYKKLLVAGVNADSEKKAIMAVREHVMKNRDKYPPLSDDKKKLYFQLKKYFKSLKNYHHLIAKYIGSAAGLTTQYVDSQIAYKVISNMTQMNIPVITVHDSFISKISDSSTLREVLKKSYVDVINSLLEKNKHKLRITEDDVFTSESDIEEIFPTYMRIKLPLHLLMFHPLLGKTEQLNRQIQYEKYKKTSFNETIVLVPSNASVVK